MIYFDNNATTIMPTCVIEKICAWMNKGNPSADYKTAKECRALMAQTRNFIAKNCSFLAYEPETNYSKEQLKKVYQVIFTSCASESNNFIIRSVATAYKFHSKRVPHFILSSIEHKSILKCAQNMANTGNIELSLVDPNQLGFIEPEQVEKAIKPNTCLISIMSANNEIGTINNIKKIGQLAHKHRVPFHTDCAQTFGKYKIDPVDCCVDAFSVSIHKLHGPPGIGLLVIKKSFIDGYHLLPEICGSQNGDMRGGTENILGIAGAYEALKYTWECRQQKNTNLAKVKQFIMEQLANKINSQTYREYLENPNKFESVTTNNTSIVFISSMISTLPNTILLAIVKRKEPLLCNVKAKKELEKRGVIISIGSACNTSNKKASHVLDALGADQFIKKGALRISLPDDVTMLAGETFVQKFMEVFDMAADGKLS